MFASILLLVSWLASPAIAGKAGSFADGGNTSVSAMMMFVGNKDKVYIIDKAEGNAAQINGHPAWGAVWDFNTHQTQLMDIKTNVFCASGMHLPNGSYVTFGGNGAIAPGGNIGSVPNGQGAASYDATYQDYDGSKSIRVLNPCTDSDDFTSSNCQWFDNPDVLSMQKKRWYSAAEPLGDGSVALIGGFVNGGYINRNTPNTDPELEGGAAEPTYEFYPANGRNATVMQFMIKTSGLNAYAHTYLMPSGKMLVQANISTMLWDPESNTENALPDMPGSVARVYPASGAVAMLPLTPANNYTPTVIFCGGSDMPDHLWGNYSFPNTDTWLYPASKDCQRLTPEPLDGSAPVYVQDDDMIEGRTMGQFIILPDGKILVVNGGLNGTAGYATNTGTTLSYNQMPFGMSLASGPVGTPALYDPNAPAGSRWSNAGFQTSNIARLYHSSAILLPDASVLIAGSNPNVDVNLTTYFPTNYQAEIFYPDYFSGNTRPVPSGIPSNLSYGGNPFDITVPASSYSGSSNDAADNTTVVVIRPGWTTHGMNMGQRFLQLNNTYTVNSDGSLTLHTAQMPPNPNIFQPGPAMLFVVVNGIPSNGTFVIIGSGSIETQPTGAASVLPDSVRLSSASGSANGSSGNDTDTATNGGVSHTAMIVGSVVAAIIVLGVIGGLIGVCVSRRRRAAAQKNTSSYAMRNAPGGSGALSAVYGADSSKALRSSDSSAFSLQPDYDHSQQWSGSTANLTGDGRLSPYHDAPPYLEDSRGPHGMSMELDPYASQSRMSTSSPHGRRY
ncbi:glyoxal oxidase [Lentinula boryana]|uniref:Glyoxal oxidase n=1 Tax=Lentinula boryana TaxID=40481 RepID=A0ABQ8QKS4_9AGAR|nr:glyoxal oxidase [Lentinula boryana]